MDVFRFRRYGRSTAGRIMAGLGVGTREMRRAPLINRPVRDYFQLWSPTYDLSPLQVVLYRPVHAAVMRATERLPGVAGPVLDLGCGTARLTRDLAQRYPRVVVVGLDIASGMLSAARQRLGAEAPSLVCGDAYSLPFANESLVLVASTIAYHWLLRPHAALAELHRVLKPGGYLLLGTLIARFFPGTWFGMRLATERMHRKDLAAAGFVVESYHRVGLAAGVFTACSL